MFFAKKIVAHDQIIFTKFQPVKIRRSFAEWHVVVHTLRWLCARQRKTHQFELGNCKPPPSIASSSIVQILTGYRPFRDSQF